MDRWKFKMDNFKMVAEPDMDKMNEFVKSSVENLCNVLIEKEEQLILDSMPFTHLVLLQSKVNEALERKKNHMIGGGNG